MHLRKECAILLWDACPQSMRGQMFFDFFGSQGKRMYKHFLKRIFDFLLSFVGILLLLLPMLLIAFLIKCDSKGPVFFRQKRVGKKKKLFNILKFRTMRTDTPHDAPTHELGDPQKWITKIGRFLRKTSLDEIPQIFNIFAGQMALIGPRPALWNQDDLIAERDKYGANDIRPGLTGWAQINGRDELEIPVKAALDGEYVRRMGFFFDLRCFFGTIAAVFKHKGVVEGGTGELHKQAQENAEADTASQIAAQESADPTEEITGIVSENTEPLAEDAAEPSEKDPAEEAIGAEEEVSAEETETAAEEATE